MSDKTPDLNDVMRAIIDLSADLIDLRAAVVDLTGLRTEIARLRTDVMARLDRHEDALIAIRDDIGVNFGRADRAVDDVKGLRTTVDHLSDELSIVTRQVRRLQSEIEQLRGGA